MNYEEPFRSCYLFGALRYLANLKDTVCLIHGPTGCSFFCRNSVMILNGYKDTVEHSGPRIFSTCFNDDDVVFGGQKKLERAINDIYNKYHPKIIFVLNCCVTEIIGENIKDVANLLGDKLGCKIFTLNSAGFKGDHKVGMINAGNLLIDSLSDNNINKEKNTLNILGEFNINLNTTQELKKYLTAGRIKVNTIFPATSTIEEINNIGSAELNYVVCNNASKNIAKKLENKFNIHSIYNNFGFFGVENSYSILEEIFNFFNIKNRDYQNIYIKTKKELKKFYDKLNGKTAIIISGNRRSLGYANLLNELGIKIKCIFTEKPLEEFNKEDYYKFTDKVLIEENSDDLRKIIEELKPDFVFSTFGEIVYPYKTIFRPKEDFAGFEGAIRFAEYLVNYEGGKR